MSPSKGTTRAVKVLAKGRQYLQPKPEAKESDESVSEQSGSNDESQPTSSSGTTEDSSKDSSTSSSDRFTPGSDDADTDDEDVSSEYPSEDEPLEQARSKKKKSGPSVGKTKEVVLDAEGISEISESSYKSATTSTDTQEMDDLEMELVMEQYVKKTGQCHFNAKFLRKIQIQVALNKHRKTKCCPYCPFIEPEKATMVQKLTRHVDKFHGKELRVLNLQRINKEIEDLEEGRETVQTETELRKLRREKDNLTHLIVYEGLYKYNIAVFKKCSETQNFESKLIVARDPTVAENPSAYDFAPCPRCLGFFQKKTMYRHKTDCPASGKTALSNTGKNIKAATFALMLEVKATKGTPFDQYVFTRMRHDEYGNIARRDPLIRYLGEWYFDKRKADEGYLQINDRMRTMAKLVYKLNCSYLIEVINPEMWPRVKEAVMTFEKSYRVKMGSILKTAAQFLRNQAWMWKKKSISETAREFLKILDSEWAAISAPAKYELVFNF